MLRLLFDSYFPDDNSAKTVPHNKSIACSTEAALEWDVSFKNNADESGRSVLGVHKSQFGRPIERERVSKDASPIKISQKRV